MELHPEDPVPWASGGRAGRRTTGKTGRGYGSGHASGPGGEPTPEYRHRRAAEAAPLGTKSAKAAREVLAYLETSRQQGRELLDRLIAESQALGLDRPHAKD